jgi:predicted O-methyltransferase YrrM
VAARWHGRGPQLVTVDNDKTLLAILKRHLGADSRLTVACADGDDFLHSLHGQRLDFIFADTSAGEYHLLDEALGLLNPGGLYVIEEMLPQPNGSKSMPQKSPGLSQPWNSAKIFQSPSCLGGSGVMLASEC